MTKILILTQGSLACGRLNYPCYVVMCTLQVGLIKELLEHLPERGCKYCVEAEQPEAIGVNRKCCCDDLFLRPVEALKWRPAHKQWFDRQRRGESWYKNLVARISSKAKTS